MESLPGTTSVGSGSGPKPQGVGSALGCMPQSQPPCRLRGSDGCTRRHVARRRNANKETSEGGGSESRRPHPEGKSGLGPLPDQGRPASRLGSGSPASRGWIWAAFPWGIPLPGFPPLPSQPHTLVRVGKLRPEGRD